AELVADLAEDDEGRGRRRRRLAGAHARAHEVAHELELAQALERLLDALGAARRLDPHGAEAEGALDEALAHLDVLNPCIGEEGLAPEEEPPALGHAVALEAVAERAVADEERREHGQVDGRVDADERERPDVLPEPRERRRADAVEHERADEPEHERSR